MSTMTTQSAYDPIAKQYAASQQRTDEKDFSFNHDLVIPHLLKVAGDVAGLTVLDAGCGEGVVTRYLADRGAQAVGIDISSQLLELAQVSNAQQRITYVVHDLSCSLPRYAQTFDLVVSNLVLNDVADYRGFIATLGAVIKPQGRLILSLTNPYSAVMREKVFSYFDSGTAVPYAWGGGHVYHFHRTMTDYISAFRHAGCLLNSLTDVQMTETMVAQLPLTSRELPWFAMYHRFPFFIILEFLKTTQE
jgi:2-polyprenyl-3-methyl-5-hydroxy-6-metoxy-1,4-benzoquinol methylase